jgi:hypothetical protein
LTEIAPLLSIGIREMSIKTGCAAKRGGLAGGGLAGLILFFHVKIKGDQTVAFAVRNSAPSRN